MINEWMGGGMYEWMDKLMDGLIGKWMEGWKGG